MVVPLVPFTAELAASRNPSASGSNDHTAIVNIIFNDFLPTQSKNPGFASFFQTL